MRRSYALINLCKYITIIIDKPIPNHLQLCFTIYAVVPRPMFKDNIIEDTY